jgi:L-ascorbate metabolism protein UlaG (beta-lactamase superfamily)
MTELIIDPARLDFIDVVTSSHNHTDHLDAQTLRPLIQANPNMKLIIPEAIRSFVADRLQMEAGLAVGLNDGMSVQLSGFNITAVPAAHETVARDEAGQCEYLSYVIQFGPWAIYHSGDTVWFDDLVGILKPFALDVAMLPINGRAPERQVAGNLNAEESARLARLIGAKIVIPHHYDMFTFNTADPQDFIRVAESEKQAYQVLSCGERWSSSMLELRS